MNIKDVSCPECGHRLKLGNHPHKGQRVTCPECESKLVVVNLRPIELDSAILVNRSAKSSKKTRTLEVPCPECDNLVKLSAFAYEGHRILCNGCHTLFEVVDTNPIELEIVFDANMKATHLNKSGKERW